MDHTCGPDDAPLAAARFRSLRGVGMASGAWRIAGVTQTHGMILLTARARVEIGEFTHVQ